MFHSRNTENRVNKIIKKSFEVSLWWQALRFDELLIKNRSVSIHQINFQFLATEILKVKNGVSTGLTENIFQFVNKPYDLRNNRILLRKRKNSFLRNRKSFILAPRILETIHQLIKDETKLSRFKTKIKTWTSSQCPCRQSKKNVGHIVFI